MSTMKLNPLLLELAKNNTGLRKAAFIPAGQAGGDPAAGGAPPPGGDPSQGGAPPSGGDPSMGGAPPPGDPSGAPPGGDPSGGAGGAPAGPPPEMMMMIQQVVTQAVQQAMQQGGQPGMPGAAGAAGPKKSKGGDEVALQLYKTNTFLMAIITALNKAGVQVEIPPEAMLGPPPGTDPSMAGAMGANVQSPGVAAPGADPNAAGGQDPNAQPQQQQMQFAPAIAPKTAADEDFDLEDAALSLGIPFEKVAVTTPPPSITEMFPPPKQAEAAEGSVQDRANMVMHMIAASRQQRQVVVQ